MTPLDWIVAYIAAVFTGFCLAILTERWWNR